MDEITELRTAVWGSALLVLGGLLIVTFLLSRLLRRDPAIGVRILSAVLILGALLISGPTVGALANAWLPSNLRVAPGVLARWGPGLVALAFVVVSTLQAQRRVRQT